MTTHRTCMAATAGALVIVAVVVILGLTGGPNRGHATAGARRMIPTLEAAASTTLPPTNSAASSGWTSVAPATTVPADSPVQQQYDQGFGQGFSNPADQAQLDQTAALPLPPPGIGPGWPNLPPSYTPTEWTTAFVSALLDIDFSRQDRSSLGSWLVAEEAPDLMPGIIPGAQLATLYATLMFPEITSERSPVPSSQQWQTDSAEGIQWAANNLTVTLDPQWQMIIAAGWQPEDLNASVEDVSGMLTVRRGTSRTTHHFSMEVQLGSAHWHPGYGTVLVSGWTES